MKSSLSQFIKISSIIVAVLCNVVMMPASAFADSMSSGGYQIQADSMNFAGDRSTSGSYTLEDTAGESATGESASANNAVHAGYQQSGAASSTNSTSTPPVNPPASNTPGASSSQSQNPKLPINVLNFTASPLAKSIDLTWVYPKDSDIVSVRIVRSDKFFPSDVNDGDVIFEGVAPQGVADNVGEIIDHDVVAGTRYYYSIFAKNSIGLYSSGVLAQTEIIPVGQAAATNPSSEDIFQNVAPSANLDPQIAKLTLNDFDFIQEGIKINQANGIIPIDGTKNLTIRLDYTKVPEILKTIALTLTDPQDSTKVFTFLLRVNSDKTAYEATLAPLGKSGDYALNGIILDYKNQSLKRFNGDLRAVVLQAGQTFFGITGKSGSGTAMMFGFLALAFLAIIVLVYLERKKRKAIYTMLD